MAGILDYLDFNHSITSRKLHHSHKRHNEGLEAPRNSVEFALESSQSCRAVHDDISYSCHNKPNFHSNGSSVRKLIENEISIKPNENSKRQSVVARLMGMDPLPDPISSLLNHNGESRDEKPIQERVFEDLQTREKHPQEEELQKFKTQFQAWQASKLLETSRSLELENFGKHKFVQSFSLQQKNSGKEKEQEILLESRNSVDVPTENSYFEEEEEKPLSPTKIVILKPCPEMIFNFNLDGSNISSPDMIKRENNMANFLEEVKNKLKFEIEGKCGGNNTDPKQIARNIANQIRETVVQDLNNNAKSNSNSSKLTRSQSARWYRTGTGDNKDTKKLLSEKIKKVLKREIDYVSSPIHSHKPRPAYDIKRKSIKLKPQTQQPNSTTQEIQEIQEISSPRNLVRSLSAPVSGSGFVKLLTEELDLSSEARMERKCENERKGRFKEGSERSGKVRNLRQNLGLRKWLFGKRIQSADEMTMEGFMPVKSFVTTPSVVVNSGFIQENFTEVPPSPASICNSPRDEIYKGGYPSPVSPLDASFIDEQSFIVQVPKETEPSNILASFISDQISLDASHDSKIEENPILDEPIIVEPHAKSYVKTLLITAGLYESQTFNQLSSRCEIHTEPIPKSVFEQVEETIADKTNSAEVTLMESLFDCENETSLSHNMLFDLTNEAILSVFGASSTFKKWVLGSVPHGKRLLDEVWRGIEKSMGVSENRACSLDDLICDDLRENSWRGVFNEEMEELGEMIEFELVDELIDELFWDVLMNIGKITQ